MSIQWRVSLHMVMLHQGGGTSYRKIFPRKQSWGEYRNHPVFLSVCLSVCSHPVWAISSYSPAKYTHTQNRCPSCNSSLPCWILIKFHKIVVLSMTQGCAMTLTQGHISKVKVSAHIPKIRVRAITRQSGKLDLNNISQNCCPWPKSVWWPWPRVILVPPRLRSQYTYIKNLCSGHNSSLPSWILILFQAIIIQDPRVCHDLDPRSYLQGQGHSAHIPQIRVQAITSHWYVGSWYYFKQLLSKTQGCVMTLTQGHISKVKVTVHTFLKSVSGS